MKNLLQKVKRKVKSLFIKEASSARISTTELVNRIFNFCEVYSGYTMYPYQEQFSKRVIRSALENDGAEITALFARQSGKSEAISLTSGGMMILLPLLANMPMFADDPRLAMFRDGIWIGIFAPSQRQAQITYGRIKSRIQSKSAQIVLTDPEFNIGFSTSNGQTVELTNGSFVTAISASDTSNIEGESFKLIICEEAQDISNFKIRKCLTGDTRVLVESGEYKRLDDIVKEGKDVVRCFDKEIKTLTSKKPTQYYNNGVQPVYKLTLNNGDTIKATLNHQFYTFSKNTKKNGPKFRTVQEIIDSQNKYSSLRIGVPESLPYFAEEKPLEYERGLILGYFLGDGCLVGTPKFCGERDVCERLHKLLLEVVSTHMDMTEYNYNNNNGISEVCFSTDGKNTKNPFIEWLKKEEVYNLVGDKKKLPDKLYSKSFYRGLIEALVESDGCVSNSTTKPEIVFNNISEGLVRQLKDIYLKFGIHSVISVQENNGSYGIAPKPLWGLSVKSVKDIRVFAENIVLFKKQRLLEESIKLIKHKVTRNESRHYEDSMRFYQVKSVEYLGEELTYCLEVEGRNFIANNMISSNSISPMGAAYNATTVKIGTASTYIGDFYEAIQRNKKEALEKTTHIRNHFEYDWTVAAKYNPKYAKYIEGEKRKLGEKSDEFQLSYCLKWIIERGMFVDIGKFELENLEPLLERIGYDKYATHVAGIDLGGKNDDTVVTMCEVNWELPVIMESRVDEETGEDITYLAYNTYLKDWFVISDEPNYEVQYPLIVEYLGMFRVVRIVCDATREASISHRLMANLKCEVIPYIFTQKSKSELYKHLDKEIVSGRARVSGGQETVQSREYLKFIEQLGDLQKGYSGTYLVVSHPDEKGAKDDFPDSWALAVWGCSSKGEVNTAETVNNKFTQRSQNETTFYKQRNRLTSRRRRR